jgi:hypothetical protein
MKNIAPQQPALVRDLVEELNGWLLRTGDTWRRVVLP